VEIGPTLPRQDYQLGITVSASDRLVPTTIAYLGLTNFVLRLPALAEDSQLLRVETGHAPSLHPTHRIKCQASRKRSYFECWTCGDNETWSTLPSSVIGMMYHASIGTTQIAMKSTCFGV